MRKGAIKMRKGAISSSGAATYGSLTRFYGSLSRPRTGLAMRKGAINLWLPYAPNALSRPRTGLAMRKGAIKLGIWINVAQFSIFFVVVTMLTELLPSFAAPDRSGNA